jgi:hypothetical protein
MRSRISSSLAVAYKNALEPALGNDARGKRRLSRARTAENENACQSAHGSRRPLDFWIIGVCNLPM